MFGTESVVHLHHQVIVHVGQSSTKTPQTFSICGVFALVPYRHCPLFTFCPFEQYHFVVRGFLSEYRDRLGGHSIIGGFAAAVADDDLAAFNAVAFEEDMTLGALFAREVGVVADEAVARRILEEGGVPAAEHLVRH